MRIVLITGRNKGLGYETARRLLAEGYKVYIGARDYERGQTASKRFGAHFVHIDVTEDASVREAALETGRIEGYLDILVNNAGVSGGMIKPGEMSVDLAHLLKF